MKMRKPKQEIVLSDVEILDAGAEGKAVAKVDNLVIFVPFVVPGDIVDLKIVKKKNNYAEAQALCIKRPSPRRIAPQCPHFGLCGGCKWQTFDYAGQLEAKQRQVKDNLERLGRVDTSMMSPICGSEKTFYYRNKLEFTFSTRRWMTAEEIQAGAQNDGAFGFHIPSFFDKVLEIEHCALQPDPSNAIRLSVRDYARQHELPFYDIRNHTGFLRNLVIRNTSLGEWMVVLIVAERDEERLFPILDMLHNRFPQITSLQYVINSKMNDSYTDLDVETYFGKDFIMERMPGYKGGKDLFFKINAKSFYQTNSEQAYRLYSFVADFADLKGDEVVYDLYTGTGTIAQFVAQRCKKVVGIEYVEEAIADAVVNAQNNGITNTTFYAGDMAKVLTSEFIAANGRPDLVITDPPRAGMHAKVVEQLLETAPKKIVYVSCNPATQARDLELLAPKYDVRRIQPVDMFPHTQHVENVAELVLR